MSRKAEAGSYRDREVALEVALDRLDTDLAEAAFVRDDANPLVWRLPRNIDVQDLVKGLLVFEDEAMRLRDKLVHKRRRDFHGAARGALPIERCPPLRVGRRRAVQDRNTRRHGPGGPQQWG